MSATEITITNDDVEGFFLISFLCPDKIKSKCKINPAFKIRGYFKTIEEAQDAAKKLQEKDPYFDIFLGQMGHWMPFNPDIDTVEEQIYREKELNELMQQYKKQKEEHDKLEEERRQKLKNQKPKEIENDKKEKEEIAKMNENYDRLKSVFDKLKNNQN